MRARWPFTSTVVFPSGPATAMDRFRCRLSSETTMPLLRTITEFPALRCHRLAHSQLTASATTSSVIQSPGLKSLRFVTIQSAVAYLDLLRLRESSRQLFAKINRTMLATGAADGDGEGAAIVAHEFR